MGVMGDFKQRLFFSLIFIVITIICLMLAFHPWFQPIFVGVVAVAAGGALWEYFQLAKSKGIHVHAKIAIVGSILYLYLVYAKIKWPQIIGIPELFLGAVLMAVFFHQFVKVKNALLTVSVTFFGIIYIVVTLGCMIKITYFFPIGSDQDGRWWLVYLLAVTKLTDVGGLFVGRFLGKIKLAKILSPKKTVEGALGGIIFGILASTLFVWLSQNFTAVKMQLTYFQAVWLGIILSVLGQFGDLAESLLKRDGGVKDSNIYLPGLGGVFDMVDSLLFTTPFLYVYLLFTWYAI